MLQSQTITQKSASNLALAFVLLPRRKRDGMCALYALCREVDDVADEDSRPVDERRRMLAQWREDVARACDPSGSPQFQVNRELQPFIQECKLPFRLFDELIQGCESDLETTRYQNQEQLDLYCYRVASVVGLLSIEIFGYTNPACREYAIHLGKALQLTNILRDVRSDAERGRIYLPLDALQQHRVSEGEILRHAYSDRFRALAESMAGLARDHYATAQRLLPPEDRRSMAAAELMGSVYWKLLCKLHARGFDVLGPQRLGLGKIQKLGLIARTWWRATTGSVSPSYGD